MTAGEVISSQLAERLMTAPIAATGLVAGFGVAAGFGFGLLTVFDDVAGLEQNPLGDLAPFG